jgi:hypothetical protein
MNRKQHVLILAVIFFCIVVCFLHAILFDINFYAISADESGRTLDAYRWSLDHTRLSDVWLPYSAFETGSMLKLWKDLFLVPRIICVFWGLCVLAALALFSFELFKDERVTMVTLLLGSIFPPVLVLAHVPLPEITFIFFIILGMYFYLRWGNTGSSFALILFSFCLALSSTIRYEGWIFVFVFVSQGAWRLYVNRKFMKGKERIVLGTAMIISLSFSIVWIIHSTLETGFPFSFVGKTSNRFSAATNGSLLRLIWHNVGTQFFLQNILTLNALGIISVYHVWRDRPNLRNIVILAFATLAGMAFVSFVAGTLPTHNSWRIAVVWSCLLLPFTAHWLAALFRRGNIKHHYSRYTIIVFIAAGFCWQMVRLIQHSSFSQYEYNAGKFLEHQFSENYRPLDKILIETSSWNYIHIIVASQHPETFLYNSGYDPKNPSQNILSLSPIEQSSVLENHHIRFLVFHSTPYKTAIEKMNNILKLSDQGEWSVYEWTSERTKE